MSPADFHSFFDVVPAPVALLDSEFCFLDLNLAFKTRVCTPTSNLIGTYGLGIFEPAPKHTALLTSNALTTGEVSSAQLRCQVNSLGLSAFNADVRIAAINDVDNRQYLMTLGEIGDDVDREPASLSRNDLFQSLISQSSMSISVQDSNYNFTIVNDAYCRLVGYSADELLGRDPINLLHPPEQSKMLVEQRSKLLNTAPSALAGFSRPREILHRSGRRVQFRLELVCVKGPDGSSLWCSTLIDPSISDSGLVNPLTGTDATAAAATLAELQEITNQCGDAMILVDLDSDRVVHANHASAKLLGVAERHSTALGIDAVWSMVRPEQQAGLRALVHSAVTDAEQFVEVIQDSGELRALRFRVFPSAVSAMHRLIVAEDVTVRRNLERNRRVEEIAHREVLVRETHHRIKNNLQGIAGLIERASFRQPALKPGLDNVILQIRSIATVHGLQIESDDRVDIVLLARAVSDSIFKIFGLRIATIVKASKEKLSWGIDEHNAVPVALALSELLTNATKHGVQPERVRLTIESEPTRTLIRISNAGSLPQWFNFRHGAELLGGLKLIKALLPHDGCELEFSEQDGQVVAQLTLRPPAIVLSD